MTEKFGCGFGAGVVERQTEGSSRKARQRTGGFVFKVGEWSLEREQLLL